jgi:hypothetical protein
MKLNIKLPQPMPDQTARTLMELALEEATTLGHRMDAYGYAEAGPMSPHHNIPAWMSVCSDDGCYAVICVYGGDEPSAEGTALSDAHPLTLEDAHVRIVAAHELMPMHKPQRRPRGPHGKRG